jgi:hypothetical protein
LPDTPPRTIVPSLIAAVLEAVRVTVPGLVGLAGVNEAVTPAGKPLTDKLTGLLKPFIPVTVTVALALLP